MMKNTKILLCILGASILMLSNCSSAQKQFGLSRSAPDEFTVIKRAPLAIPPSYALSTPRPGAQRPQEPSTAIQARNSVFGTPQATSQNEPTAADSAFLRDAGAQDAQADIRATINSEANTDKYRNRSTVDKLLNLSNGRPSATVVNAQAEAERLHKSKKDGIDPTQGETPYIEQ